MTTVPSPAFDVDWHARPEDVVRTVRDRAERLETPLAGGGVMVWHRWPKEPNNRPEDALPLVLVHGGWGSWTHWLRNVPVLAARSTVLACDLPGLGESDAIGRPETITPVAEAVAAGIESLLDANTRFDIAGFSFGGIASSHAAVIAGERCRSFTAIGAAGFGDLHYIVGGIQVPDPRLTDAEIDAVHRNNLKILMLAEDAAIDPLAVHVHRQNISAGRFRSRRISVSNGLVEALPDMQCAIGGIWGDLDVTGNGLAAIEQRRDIFRQHRPDSPFDIISGGGHWIMYEKPEAFEAALIGQLDAHGAAEAA